MRPSGSPSISTCDILVTSTLFPESMPRLVTTYFLERHSQQGPFHMYWSQTSVPCVPRFLTQTPDSVFSLPECSCPTRSATCAVPDNRLTASSLPTVSTRTLRVFSTGSLQHGFLSWNGLSSILTNLFNTNQTKPSPLSTNCEKAPRPVTPSCKRVPLTPFQGEQSHPCHRWSNSADRPGLTARWPLKGSQLRASAGRVGAGGAVTGCHGAPCLPWDEPAQGRHSRPDSSAGRSRHAAPQPPLPQPLSLSAPLARAGRDVGPRQEPAPAPFALTKQLGPASLLAGNCAHGAQAGLLLTSALTLFWAFSKLISPTAESRKAAQHENCWISTPCCTSWCFNHLLLYGWPRLGGGHGRAVGSWRPALLWHRWGRSWGPEGRGGKPPGGGQGSRACSALGAGALGGSIAGSDWISWHASTLIWERKIQAGTLPRKVTACCRTGLTPRVMLSRPAWPAPLRCQHSAAADGSPRTARTRPSSCGPRASRPAGSQQGGLGRPPGQRRWPQTTAEMRIPIGTGVRRAGPTHFAARRCAGGERRIGERQRSTTHLLEVAPTGAASLKAPASNSYCCLGFPSETSTMPCILFLQLPSWKLLPPSPWQRKLFKKMFLKQSLIKVRVQGHACVSLQRWDSLQSTSPSAIH